VAAREALSVQRVNIVRVMAKPLGAETLRNYLALIARDRPD